MSTQQTVRLISLVASGILAARRFVKIDGNGKAAYPSAQAAVSGVTQEAADAAGKVIPCALPDGAIVKVEAGAILAAGVKVASSATGTAIAHGAAAGNMAVAVTKEAAAAIGDIIEVQFIHQGQA